MIRQLLVILALSPATIAIAEPADRPQASGAHPARYDLGVRVGGYGFRREGDTRPGKGWTECRMDGLGLFGTRALPKSFFVEIGLDMYASSDLVMSGEASDLPIDRTSGLASAAIGIRTPLASWLRGYAQLGAGLELTRVSVPYGEDRTIRDTKLMPEGFFGLGVDVRVGTRTYLGATFRALAMGNFNYDPKKLEMGAAWVSPSADTVFDASLGFAAQGQFYVRRDL